MKQVASPRPSTRGTSSLGVELALLFGYTTIILLSLLSSFHQYAWIQESQRLYSISSLCVVLLALSSSFQTLFTKLQHLLHVRRLLSRDAVAPSTSVRLAREHQNFEFEMLTLRFIIKKAVEDPKTLLESFGDTESEEEYHARDLAPSTLRALPTETEEPLDFSQDDAIPFDHVDSPTPDVDEQRKNLSHVDDDGKASMQTGESYSKVHREPSRRGGIPISSPARVVLATNDVNSEVQISTTIDHYGHFCTVVRSGAALMERIRKEDFDIAILDLSLPDYDRIIVKDLKNPKLVPREDGLIEPVVKLTPTQQPNVYVVGLASDVSEAVRSRCIQEGIVEVMSKPPSDLMIDTVIRSVPCEPRPPAAKVASQRSKSLQSHQKKPTLLKMNTSGNFLTMSKSPVLPSAPSSKPLPLSKSSASQTTLIKKSSLSKPTSSTSPRSTRVEVEEEAAESGTGSSSLPAADLSMQPDLVSVEDRLRLENAKLHEKVANLKQQLQQTQRTLDAVIPPEYQQHIARNRHLVLGKVACRPLTIMFSDIRNFSRQAESMSVDALMEFVNSWLSFALPPVSDHGGFVDKFIGDSIMCIFAHDDIGSSAIESVRAAVEMMRSLDYMKGLQGLFSCDTGVGINTGKCMMGVLGIETRMEPTVLGDAVNLASRTESLTKKYGARVLITEHTKAHLGAKESEWVIRLVDHVYVVGKSFPVRLYEVVDGEPPEVRQKKTGFIEKGWWTTAIAQFEAGHFAQAVIFFQKCLHVYPLDIPSRIYVQRCFENMQPDFDINTWQAIYPLESK
jgi:class 3 adenylate cyclase/DNA-binding NarL/FixJ family response regulator